MIAPTPDRSGEAALFHSFRTGRMLHLQSVRGSLLGAHHIALGSDATVTVKPAGVHE